MNRKNGSQTGNKTSTDNKTTSWDTLFDLLGTIFLMGFSLLFLATSVRGFVVGSSTTDLAISAAFLTMAILVAGAALNILPPFRN